MSPTTTTADLLELCRKRHSTRSYTGEPVDPSDLEMILEAGRWAATSRNYQARRFAVITGREEIKEFAAKAAMQEWIPGVGALIVGWATDALSGGSVADVIISMTQMDLAAVAAGYGTCMLGTWDGPAVTKLIGGDASGRVVNLLAIGRPAGPVEVKDKLSLADLVGRGRLP